MEKQDEKVNEKGEQDEKVGDAASSEETKVSSAAVPLPTALTAPASAAPTETSPAVAAAPASSDTKSSLASAVGLSVPPGLIASTKSTEKTQDNVNLLSQVLQVLLKTEIALSPVNTKGWYYHDASNTLQGPFQGAEMSEWYGLGYLPQDLKLSSSPTGESYPIAAIRGSGSSFSAAEMFDTNIDVEQVRSLRNNLKNLLNRL